MEKKFKFAKPIKIQGNLVEEIAYDEEEITVELFNEACERGTARTVKEINDKLHLHLFWAAVMAVNHEVEFTTLNQIKGIKDLLAMGDIGRNFILGLESSDQSNLGEQSENMPEGSIPALLSSENSD
ncbi:hypothetical protein LI177_05270 [bacterium 210820-DFI.6.37]|nr:hypothetical protein [bacterium 210820-DFI.6.37]